MRDQNHQELDLFGSTFEFTGYRGRASTPILYRPGRWALAIFFACLFGLATTAAAITIHKARVSQTDSIKFSLPANFVRPFGSGFEEALY